MHPRPDCRLQCEDDRKADNHHDNLRRALCPSPCHFDPASMRSDIRRTCDVAEAVDVGPPSRPRAAPHVGCASWHGMSFLLLRVWECGVGASRRRRSVACDEAGAGAGALPGWGSGGRRRPGRAPQSTLVISRSVWLVHVSAESWPLECR